MYANFINALLLLLSQHLKSLLLVVVRPLKKMLVSILLQKMRLLRNSRWVSPGTHMLSRFARVMCLYLVGSAASKDSTPWKSILWLKTNGCRQLPWKTNVTTCLLAQSTMSLFTHLEVSSEVPSKRLMTLLRFLKSKRTTGMSIKLGWE